MPIERGDAKLPMDSIAPQLFDLGHGFAVNFNPQGRFHGWLFKRHPDGQYVSIRKLSVIENPFDPLLQKAPLNAD